ncbi:MAG: hypothetical protein ACXADU_11175 [Promethearchaeota archaeon]|jgi:uncharacterized protein YlaN (UPF0358 family)
MTVLDDELNQLFDFIGTELSNLFEEKEEKKPTIKETLHSVLENQTKLIETLNKVSMDQLHLSKMVYYSLELIQQTLGSKKVLSFQVREEHKKDIIRKL